MISQHIFKTYDIRGETPDHLNINTAYAIGYGYGMLHRTNKQTNTPGTMVIGYDSRITSPSLSSAFQQGLEATGYHVINLGLCPTPMLYFAIWFLDNENQNHPLLKNLLQTSLQTSFQNINTQNILKKTYPIVGGAIITGSHLDPEFNGIKLVTRHAKPFYGDSIQTLYQWIVQHISNIPSPSIKQSQILENISQYVRNAYVQILLNQSIFLNPNKKTSMNFVWDCGNGATGKVVQELTYAITKKTKSKQIILFPEPDGSFPNRSPDPTQDPLTALSNTIKDQRYNGGFAFDGDGDRVIVLDSTGTVLSTQSLFICFVQDVLTPTITNNVEKPQVIMDLRTSRSVQDWVTYLKGESQKVACGHPFIKQGMQDKKAVLGGEMSGHFYFKDHYFGYDDGLYAALRYMHYNADLLQNKSYSIPKNQGISYHTSKEYRINVSDKEAVMTTIKKHMLDHHMSIQYHDGLYVETTDSFILIRPSNTENKISITFEAKTTEQFSKLYKILGEWIPELLNQAL